LTEKVSQNNIMTEILTAEVGQKTILIGVISQNFAFRPTFDRKVGQNLAGQIYKSHFSDFLTSVIVQNFVFGLNVYQKIDQNINKIASI